jgi:hypothetical protein
VDSALSVSVSFVRIASEDWAASTTTGTEGAAVVGTTTVAAAGVALGALGAFAAFTAGGTVGAELAGAGAGAASAFFVTFLSTAILFVLGTEVEEDISNALVMIITYRGYVNRFRVQTR